MVFNFDHRAEEYKSIPIFLHSVALTRLEASLTKPHVQRDRMDLIRTEVFNFHQHFVFGGNKLTGIKLVHFNIWNSGERRKKQPK